MPQFREQATRAHRQNAQIFGDVILSSPLHHRLYAGVGIVIGTALVMLLIFGQYTRRITVSGQLLPEQGVIRLYAPGSATVAATYVTEGAAVERGALLFKLINPKYGSDGGDATDSLLRTITARRSAIEAEIASTETLQALELTTLLGKRAGLEKGRKNLERQHQIAVERHQIAQELAEKFAKLAATGFVSSEQYSQKRKDMLEQSLAVSVLEKQIEELDEALRTAHKEISALPLKHANSRSALFRFDQEMKRELLEENAQNGSAVVAPIAGRVTALMAKPGNRVAPGELIGTLIPHGARLQANLYVPSHGIGFITPGAKVYLRHRAYPYQKFGQAQGTVVDISATSLRPDELDNGARVSELTALASPEPVYRVRVALSSQQVAAGGRDIPLLAGALLDADIMLDRKPLYRWILDPIGKFSTNLHL